MVFPGEFVYIMVNNLNLGENKGNMILRIGFMTIDGYGGK
jgi:hypothetical protein